MKLNSIVNYLLLLIALTGAIWWGVSQRAEKLRYRDNFEAEQLYMDQERQITGRELKQLYETAEDLQKKLGIKPKQVVQWMQAEVKYIDTGSTVIQYNPTDTVFVYPDSLYGSIDRDCYKMDWLLYRGLFSEKMAYNDSLQIMLYRERANRVWFVRFGRWKHKAALYSSCRDSVYKVFDNVSVVGR